MQVYIGIKQKICRVKDLPTEILACLFASLVFTGLPNHFTYVLTVSQHIVLTTFLSFVDEFDKKSDRPGKASFTLDEVGYRLLSNIT